MKFFHTLLLLTIFLLGLLFALQNSAEISLHFFRIQKTMPLSVCLALVLGLGFVFGMLYFGVKNLRLRRDLYVLKRRLDKLPSRVEES